MRAFVALDLGPEQRSAVGALLLRWRGVAGYRLVDPESCHLTLKFLGQLDAATLEEFRERLGRIRVPAFQWSRAGLGAFPDAARPRILWVGVGAPGELARLAEEVHRATDRVPLDRPFAAHVTLARAQERRAPSAVELLAGAIAPAATTAREFLLVESRQDAPAPRYRVVQRFPLGG